jgi:ribonuclease BN (tRNA processing enzyme)
MDLAARGPSARWRCAAGRSTTPAAHPRLTILARLGDAIGYSGDTAWTDVLVESARGTDLFACEAYTYDKPVPYHLDYATLRRHSSRLATDRLILTHMRPTMLARLDQVEHDTVSDGLVIHL